MLDAAAGRMPVFVDGGFRRGSDVAKALALGAKGVFVGRPAAFALGGGGEAGVASMLQTLIEELQRTMALIGAVNIAAIERGHLTR